MVKDLVASSPFINLEFIEAGEIFNVSNVEKLFDYYKIDSGAVSFNLNRDFVDYRITPFFSKDQISELNINHFDLDSLSYFQVSEFLNHHTFSSIKIEKSDIAVYLQLPDNYDSYLKNLSKKNRHELKRKKGYLRISLRIFLMNNQKMKLFLMNSLHCIEIQLVKKVNI